MSRPGFTLIEVLVALSLAVMLMAGIWMIVDNHRQLQEKGNKQVIRTQVVRGLARRFDSDMQRLRRFANRMGVHRVPKMESANLLGEEQPRSMEPPASRELRSSSGGDPVTGPVPSMPPPDGIYFSGTPTSITFNLPREQLPPLREVDGAADVFGPDPYPQMGSASVSASPTESFDGLSAALGFSTNTLPLAQRVRYQYDDPLNATSEFDDPYSFDDGLYDDSFASTEPELQVTQLKRTAGFIERFHFGMDSESAGSGRRLVDNLDGSVASSGLGWDDESEPLETGEVEDAIPEVIWCRFYYYDGFQWQTQWDSGIDEGLPVAVAMHIVVNEPLELTDGELIDPLESWTDASQPSNDEPSALATSRSLPSASAETVTDEFDESDRPDGNYHRIICALAVPDPTSVVVAPVEESNALESEPSP